MRIKYSLIFRHENVNCDSISSNDSLHFAFHSRNMTTTLLGAFDSRVHSLIEQALGERLPFPSYEVPKTEIKSTHYSSKHALKSRVFEALNPSEHFLLSAKESPGVIIQSNFVSNELAKGVYDGLHSSEYIDDSMYRTANIGHGQRSRANPNARGDRIHWIAAQKHSYFPALLQLLDAIRALILGTDDSILVGKFQLVKDRTSSQIAIFDDGSRFVRHTDVSSETEVTDSNPIIRKITCVYYVNASWKPDRGGCVRMYYRDKSSSSEKVWDIAPELNTLVIFRSEDVEHEVLRASTDRLAITTWFYGLRDSSPRQNPQTPKIFVGIPSYRDPECSNTVDDLLRKAAHPGRIYIGICMQCEENAPEYRYLTGKKFRGRVRIDWMNYKDAAGPCIARNRVQALWNKEQYYLQIDSHMRFAERWDEFLLEELAKCSSQKAILTAYPPEYYLSADSKAHPHECSTDQSISPSTEPTILCASHFDDTGMLRQAGRVIHRPHDRPIPSLFWAAGFSFSSASVIEEAPYDPFLQFLFFGEEVAMGSRLWTCGWDFFAPTKSVVYHRWSRAYRPVFQVENAQSRSFRSKSHARVRSLLQGKLIGRYALGQERSLESYQAFIGVNLETKIIEQRSLWGNLDPREFIQISAQDRSDFDTGN
uniref:Putative n=1 Tax=Albugo laibachii Nc14 TaxID=890382 RepID=F0W225_9STRA|nr:putative [Albugo laibachii Nc14]|eukprot:CCA15104.1 putative [Albugo laibachii Nc14]